MLAIQKGNHNFGTTSHCRVPLRKRAPQQRITPDIQTGCISCASGDGRFGGPIWWNTPLEDEEAEAKDNRTMWSQTHEQEKKEEEHDAKRPRLDETKGEGQLVEKNPEETVEKVPPAVGVDEDEIPDDVKERLIALKKSMGHAD